MEDDRKFCGKRLRAVREREKMTHRKLSYEVGCTQAFVRDMENGKETPSPWWFGKLCAALRCTPDDLYE